MRINQLTKEEVLRTLTTSEHGLDEQEALRRFGEFGPNEIEEVRRTPLWVKFLRQFTHFLAVLLWIAAGLSFLSEYMSPGEGMFRLGVAIVCVIVINAIFTFIQEYRAELSIEKLRQMLPFNVKVIRAGAEREIPAREVVPGDIVLLSEGDKVPADVRLIEGNTLVVNNAPLTGESEPVSLGTGEDTGELTDSKNIAFAGTTVSSGLARAVVFSTGMTTEFGRIAHLTSGVETEQSPLQKEIVRATRIVAVIAMGMGALFFGIGQYMGRSFWESFLFAVGIIVANVPEGLLPTVTLALAMGSQRMAKKNALIKNLESVETLGCVSVICTDKTGTLTQNRMTVNKHWPGPDPALSRIAYLCNNARFVDGVYKGDPTETALYQSAREAMGDLPAERLSEIAFDSDRKRMTVVCQTDGVRTAFVKGAIESVLPLCSMVLKDGFMAPMTPDVQDGIMKANNEMMDAGLRVLAFAHRVIEGEIPTDAGAIERDLVFAGLIGLVDPARPEVKDAISKCHGAGIKVIMITGDGSRVARAIGREIGLVAGEPVIVEGRELEQMPDARLRELLGFAEIIFARMTPRHKNKIVGVLKEMGERVAVTGDGVNDAPALKRADIGIAMGKSGTDVAKEAADVILLDDNFATIVSAIEEGRAVYENIRKFICYIFSSNVAEVMPYLAYIVLRVPLPLTIIQILAVDLGTDMLPALALGTESPTKDLMSQPPRDPHARLLGKEVLVKGYLFFGLIEAVAGLFGFFAVLLAGGWIWNHPMAINDPLYMQATTVCLTAIVVTQVANVFACRSFRQSVFSIGFFTNKLIFVGIAVELGLQFLIVYHPLGNEIFATRPMDLWMWMMLVPFAILLFAASEAEKILRRRKA